MRHIVTTVYNGQRKFLYTQLKEGKRSLAYNSVAVDAVKDATNFNDIDDAAEAAGAARSLKRWRGWSWHEAVHPDDAKTFNNEIKIAFECNGKLP